MRKVLIVVVMLLSFVPAFHGQDDGLPLCSLAELVFVADQQPGYDELYASLSTGGDTSLEQTLTFIEAQIEWREQLWLQLPPCAEAIEVAVLMSQNTSDIGSMAALTYSGISLSLNRYKDRLFFENSNRDRPCESAGGDRRVDRR